MLKDKLALKKPVLAEQKGLAGPQEKKRTLEEGAGKSEGLQGCY